MVVDGVLLRAADAERHEDRSSRLQAYAFCCCICLLCVFLYKTTYPNVKKIWNGEQFLVLRQLLQLLFSNLDMIVIFRGLEQIELLVPPLRD